MEAIHLNERKIVARRHRYACGGIIVTPNPPQVGVETILAFYLKNPGPEPLTVTRLEAKVSQFGMGASWEELPVIGPIELPGDPGHIEEVTMRWTPRTGGHRCVRANIFVEQEPQPFLAGCNLTIIESEAHKRQWDIPFRLGNPEPVRMPIVLDVHGTEEVRQYVIVNGRVVRAGQPIWLEAGEEVDARLMLHAQTLEALESVNRIEAMIGDRFLDGIEVILRRPAWQGTGPSWSADSTPRPFAHISFTSPFVRNRLSWRRRDHKVLEPGQSFYGGGVLRHIAARPPGALSCHSLCVERSHRRGILRAMPASGGRV